MIEAELVPEPEDTQAGSEARVQSLVNATALRGLLDDPRWGQFIEPLLAQQQSRSAKRMGLVPLTLDGALQAAYLRGKKEGVEELRRTLSQLRRLADRIVEEARHSRPV